MTESLSSRDILRSIGFGAEDDAEAVKDFQRFHGMVVDGWVGRKTERALSSWQPFFCGVTERLGMSHKLGRWIKKEVSWGYIGVLLGFSPAETSGAYAEAFGYWSSVCGLKFRHAKGEPTADIVISFGRIDGRNGTLAWSELPNGKNDKTVNQKYDTSEQFVDSENPGRYEIDLVRVACHEIGHAIGIPHLPVGRKPDLMNPTYSRRIRRPQPGDILQAIRRYGNSKQPQDPDLPTPPDGFSGDIQYTYANGVLQKASVKGA